MDTFSDVSKDWVRSWSHTSLLPNFSLKTFGSLCKSSVRNNGEERMANAKRFALDANAIMHK